MNERENEWMNELKRELINELIQLHEYLSKLTKF